MEGIAGYVLRRILVVPITLFVVSFAMFYITRWGPGDPVSIYSGQYRDEEAFERVRETVRSRRPDHRAVRDLRRTPGSARRPRPELPLSRPRRSTEIIRPKIWVSFQVALFAFIIVYTVGIPVGVFAALKQGTWRDPLLIGSFLVFDSIPVLVFVPVLVRGVLGAAALAAAWRIRRPVLASR